MTSNEIRDGLFFHAVIQGRDITLQLPREIQPALAGLPGRSPVFTGRGEHFDALLREIEPSRECATKNLIHLVSGLGGVGKTEFISQVAYDVIRRGWFPGGVLFIDLFGYDERRHLPSERALVSLLQAIGVPEEVIPEDLQNKVRLYRSILAAYAQEACRILVLIDNASSVDQVSSLLPSDGVNVTLVTSRHTLNIGARIQELRELEPNSSVELLRNALRVARGEDDTRIDQNIESAHELSRMCGHLPLALQICAAILADSPMRPIVSLVDSLKNAHSRIDALQREERTVRAVFDLSYALLTERERRTLGFISFSPGFDISTAATARLVDAPESEAEEILLALARAHLVEHGAAWGRWRLHDLVRLYALEAVADIPGQEDAVLRLFDYYLECSRVATGILGGATHEGLFASREDALAWFDAEYQNLIAAVRISVNQPGLIRYAAELPHRLARYLDIRRLFNDWKDVMETSHQLIRGTGNLDFEANSLDSLGMVYRELHQIPSAISHHREAVGIAREMGDEKRLAQYLNNMGNALLQGYDFQGALDAHSEAASIFIGQQDLLSFARASDNSANALRELGRTDEALELHGEAVRTFKDAGATENEARALSHMGSTLLDVGRYSEAVTVQRRASELLKELHLLGAAGYALLNLSNSLRANGDLGGALKTISESLDIHESTGDAVGKARALNQRGLILTDLRDFDRASADFHEFLTILSPFDGLIDVGYAHANLGRLYGIYERPVEAIDHLEKAANVFSQCKAENDLLTVRRLISALSVAVPESE
ncbi:ATP-binding protein [Streptomyces sp. NPDC018036]|uniref:ATP-binding protein n=1 Tax=Streptomyces sp. NPDC018036 TaxID=3365035 RepID=UPI0037AE0011